MSWSNDYVGLDYAVQTPTGWVGTDCWELIRIVMAEVFSIDVSLCRWVPEFESGIDWTVYAEEYDRFSLDWRQVDQVRDGDLVVFSGYSGEKHIGIATSGTHFLHTLAVTGSVVEPLEGFWAERLDGIYRHKSRYQAGDDCRLLEPADLSGADGHDAIGRQNICGSKIG